MNDENKWEDIRARIISAALDELERYRDQIREVETSTQEALRTKYVSDVPMAG